MPDITITLPDGSTKSVPSATTVGEIANGISPRLAQAAYAGMVNGQVVDLTSHFEDGERHAHRFIVVEYPIPVGCAAAYFPEANPLVPLESFADKSMTPTSKSLIITVEPSRDAEKGSP